MTSSWVLCFFLPTCTHLTSENWMLTKPFRGCHWAILSHITRFKRLSILVDQVHRLFDSIGYLLDILFSTTCRLEFNEMARILRNSWLKCFFVNVNLEITVSGSLYIEKDAVQEPGPLQAYMHAYTHFHEKGRIFARDVRLLEITKRE